MLSILLVNGGNYVYNLLLGRILGPSQFADAAILITLLLVLSFIGMTFQIVTAKYAVLYEKSLLQLFLNFIYKNALYIGVLFAVAIVTFSKNLQDIFHTQTSSMFVIFGLGLPLYITMSINRGLYQGKNELIGLSKTYYFEMLCRLILTFSILYCIPSLESSVVIAIGILISFIFGLFPFQKKIISKIEMENNEDKILNTKSIIQFFALTAFYELTQIIINNSDVLLVKHYFENHEAGLYASLALIGRVVYFVAWMFVMLLLPKVIQLKKDGFDTFPILAKYVLYISFLSTFIVLVTYLFPNLVVKLMFGEKYLPIAFLLWKYALATSIFAIANIFAYYFLSISKYIPVIISGVLGLTQVILIVFFHESLEQVVLMQIIAMLVLLLFQITFFAINHLKKV
ncbi:Sugar isomerase [Flavobacterium sp. 9AF]|uniref:oligosaccharide flippase family protein n=1 Tax=Flavobacterium sp. 9AF TaxID=2653142 RepID=UPI0012EF97B0|nr:oligosaccharide flippase family protein [Flavobacterium sp. 9AF]VXB21195.1 Sugar isomerase [Flavobacterium sp. 9AF]